MTQTITPEQRLKATRYTFACAKQKAQDEPTQANLDAEVMRLTRWEDAIKDAAIAGHWNLLTGPELTMLAENLDDGQLDIRSACLGRCTRDAAIAAIRTRLTQ